MKILLINDNLGRTGGSRVIINLAKYFVDEGHSVDILINNDKCIAYSVDDRVRIYKHRLFSCEKISTQYEIKKNHYGGKASVIRKYHIKRALGIKSILKFLFGILTFPLMKHSFNKLQIENGYDLIVNNNIYTNLESFFYPTKGSNYYVNFHNSPVEVFSRKNFHTLLPLKYYFSNVKISAVSGDIIKELNSMNLTNESSRNFVIYNPFDFDHILEMSCSDSDSIVGDYFIYVGSLCERKRVDRLITSYAYYLRNCNGEPVKLLVLGSGEEKTKLEEMVSNFGISSNVIFREFCDNPYPLISKAKALLLASDSEGLPTVLLESLILKVPVVSTNCPTGPSEILVGKFSQCLVDISNDEKITTKNFAGKISESLTVRFSKSDYEKVTKRFCKNTIVKCWITSV